MRTIGAHKTAIQRWSLSRPVALALEDGLISTDTTFFDYGCGRGGDVKRLHKMGVHVAGWDPAYFPDEERTPADVVNLGYVVNVIEDPEERAVVLYAAWTLTRKLLIVSARLEWEAKTVAGDFQGDGIVTGKRTFQKFYAQDELRDWVQAVTGRSCVAAAPGVFYVFRNSAEEQAFNANRLTRPRRVPTVPLGKEDFKRHRDILRPLIEFVSQRGRLPRDSELDAASEIVRTFGSLHRAFSLVRHITGSDQWEKLRRERRDDLLVYLALAAFGKRPKLSQLPDSLRYDIRAFFGTYKAARGDADRLLFSAGHQQAINHACGEAPIGKILPDALYVHHSALSQLPPLLRVYEGCGRLLAGSVADLTLVKLSRNRPRVSYLVYPGFDRLAHPALAEAYVADLSRLILHHHDYRLSTNPPILHRKEFLVSRDYPGRRRFARLTAKEHALGLLTTERPIGRRKDWLAVLHERGLSVEGHHVTLHTN